MLALLPALLLHVPPPTVKRTAVLLIPMDRGAEASVVKLESYLTEALEAFPKAVVKPTEELFGLPTPESTQTALQQAEEGYREGKASFDAHDWKDAERKLRATVEAFPKAAAAMKDCGHYCDATALFAAALQTRGEDDEAKAALLDLFALNPNYEFDVKRFSREFLSFRVQVATSHAASLRGGASVKTKPEGARIYVDGQFLGYSPAALEAVPLGKHLLRVERPGFRVHGQLLEIEVEDRETMIPLTATPGYKTFEAATGSVISEMKGHGGSAIAALGDEFGLAQALIGTVKQVNENGALELELGLFDLTSGHKISAKPFTFQGEEYGQLKAEVGRALNQVMNAANAPDKTSKSSDPLENRHGTEEWGGDDRGGKSTSETPKYNKKKDPLEGVSGTEDW